MNESQAIKQKQMVDMALPHYPSLPPQHDDWRRVLEENLQSSKDVFETSNPTHILPEKPLPKRNEGEEAQIEGSKQLEQEYQISTYNQLGGQPTSDIFPEINLLQENNFTERRQNLT